MFKSKKRTIVLSLIFILLIITPVILNIYYKFLLKSATPNSQESKIFVIAPGEPVVEIAQNLKEAGLIKNQLAFRFLVSRMGIGEEIQAGDFRLSPAMTSFEIAEELTHGAIDIWVTFPEGLRVEEQAEIVEKTLKTSTNDVYQFDKNQYIELAQEGYMFPDTYLIPKDATAADVVALLKNTFNVKVDPTMFTDASQNNLSEKQLLTLASIIEREAETQEEKPIIAGILINRLKNGIALQVDATVQYAIGKSRDQKTWWPQITQSDYQKVRSSYSTYQIVGLPPGPIASPGLDSIKAAANPQSTDYLYYLHDSDGNIHYAKTIEEHNKNIQEYFY